MRNKNRKFCLKNRYLFLFFAAAVFIVYSNTLKLPFVFDDRVHLQENPHIRLTELNFEDIVAAGFKSPNPNRPIANISFALNYYFHRDNVIGYHYTNSSKTMIIAEQADQRGGLAFIISAEACPRKSGEPGSGYMTIRFCYSL